MMTNIEDFIKYYIGISNKVFNDDDAIETLKIIDTIGNEKRIDGLIIAINAIESDKKKYFLLGLLDEWNEYIRDAMDNYKIAIKKGHEYALFRLATICDGHSPIGKDKITSFCLYAEYYKNRGEIKEFMENNAYFHDTVFIEEIIDMSKTLNGKEYRISTMEKREIELENKIEKLERKLTKIKYAPNGEGYDDAKNHFNEIVQKQKE